MAFPDDQLPNQWTDGESVNATEMHNRIDVPLNQLAAQFFASGKQSMTVTAANTTVGPVTVPFGKTFPSAPSILLTVNTTVPLIAQASVNNVTTTGFDLYFERSDTGTHTNVIMWLAVLA